MTPKTLYNSSGHLLLVELYTHLCIFFNQIIVRAIQFQRLICGLGWEDSIPLTYYYFFFFIPHLVGIEPILFIFLITYHTILLC